MRTEFHTATLVMPKISRKRRTPRGITFQELLQGLKTLDFLRMGSHVQSFGFVVFLINIVHINHINRNFVADYPLERVREHSLSNETSSTSDNRSYTV